ncbi:MAG: tRNA lysidine(34) synthetase TilS [Candidatus Omnitrophica bacterium]|nr:tRNA lysidine(34) synthetase TilS [Candidatus Omnitrophota bacterium]
MIIVEKVKNTIKKYNLIQQGDKIVVGVSGGPDSVALLFLLYALRNELKITLHIAHLDHMLRKDSHKDKEFVETLAQRLKLPITAAKINVKEIAKKGSPEEIARNARLGFLFRVAKDTKADKIALAHNLDDQAETVLMRILRGTGLYGLAGILPKRDIAGYQIIRPLIEVRRKEIEAFLKRRKIKPCRDASNLEEVYFRNKIRNKLLPVLEEGYSSNIKEILSNLAESAGIDYDYLYTKASYLIQRFGRRINLKVFLRLHPALQRIVLRLAIARLQGSMRRITFAHIREIEDLILSRPVNSIVDLPKGISVVKKSRSLFFYRR